MALGRRFRTNDSGHGGSPIIGFRGFGREIARQQPLPLFAHVRSGRLNSPMSLSIYGLLQDRSERTPKKSALLAPGRAPLSYAGLLRQVEAVAKVLDAHDIGAGDRVAVVLPNGPEMAACFLSIAAVAACAPLNPAYRDSEFEQY